ncbi:metallophosphoesterase [Actinoplanes aureus]|uniref:Metallophosphoesterase n=1 Tax=Actinoplanes aureus TaxID=2792083 RepID=A0A931CHF7_9ACTN|nr:metallophosphoesterase [Actinoplanes aureus]MBG0567323.1 metallophosphoesterase [Actinoplanes aureus]
MRILHLSDTHLTRAPGPNSSGIDPRESLRRILDECRELPDLDAVVITGDVADDGSTEAYTDARDLIGAFAGQRRIPAILSTGNHDERAAFTGVLGSGHLDGAEHQLDAADGARAAVTTVDGWRIITLDSLVPGKGYGHLSTEQLAWLRDVLAVPAPHGSVLGFHHPPVMVPGVAVQHALGLSNGDDLAEAIRGSDVRIVLCGHFHLQLSGMLAGVPVWVTPGVVNRIDLTATPGTERAVRGASASLIDLGGPHSPVCHTLHARDPRLGQTAYELGAAELAAVITALGPPVP